MPTTIPNSEREDREGYTAATARHNKCRGRSAGEMRTRERGGERQRRTEECGKQGGGERVTTFVVEITPVTPERDDDVQAKPQLLQHQEGGKH